jgi:hypothetical protein
MNDDVRPRHDATLDAYRLGRRQVTVVILCALVAMVDGFDTQSIALAAPNVAASWHASPAAFGPIFGIGLSAVCPARSPSDSTESAANPACWWRWRCSLSFRCSPLSRIRWPPWR